MAFVAAERREFDGLLGRAERITKLAWPLQFARLVWISGQPLLLVADGPGPKLAGRAVEVAGEYQDLKGIVSTGFCGALHPALQPCDIFVATELVGVAHAPSLPHSCERYQSGKLLSIDRVAVTASDKAQLAATGAGVLEMEAAAVARQAAQWNLPFYCVRVVTDTATESFPLDFNRMRDDEGRFSRARILGAALRKPFVFPDLLRLHQRSKKAAQVLGDFLANARF